MHTEHLQNVRPSWVLFGWFISVAIVSLLALLLAATGLVDTEASGGGLWGVLAIAVGFGIGGWLLGARTGVAPILQGVAMGLVSLLLWFLANVLAGETLDASEWLRGSEAYYAGLLIAQIAAAVVGAKLGSRSQRRSTAGS
jgi:hypothetical protein